MTPNDADAAELARPSSSPERRHRFLDSAGRTSTRPPIDIHTFKAGPSMSRIPPVSALPHQDRFVRLRSRLSRLHFAGSLPQEAPIEVREELEAQDA